MTYNEIRMLMDHYFSFSNKICSNENPIFVKYSDDVDVDFSTTTLSGLFGNALKLRMMFGIIIILLMIDTAVMLLWK